MEQGVGYISIVIQSSDYDAAYLNARAEAFLIEYYDNVLVSYTNEELEEFKTGMEYYYVLLLRHIYLTYMYT